MRRSPSARVAGPMFVVLTWLSGVRPMSDDVLFHIKWPGHTTTLPLSGSLYRDEDTMIMTTADNEQYKCLLPSESAQGDGVNEMADETPDPEKLLEPLFRQNSCSYRIEPYWTYEVCHKRHIRQYHEEKEFGLKITVQEYYLGYFGKGGLESTQGQEAESKDTYFGKQSSKNKEDQEVATKNIDGQQMPYFPLEFGEGTACSLRGNTPRRAIVMYVCHPGARHEVLSVAEVTSCEYEVVVLTPFLCRHPKYRFKPAPVNDIHCQSLQGSPARPKSLDALLEKEEENKRSPNPQFPGESHVPSHRPSSSPIAGQKQQVVGTPLISSLTDQQLVRAFLDGSHCVRGGVGWWKHEFCYGRHVHQFHEEKDGFKNVIAVGTWNLEQHKEWVQKNNPRTVLHRPDGSTKIRSVSHFYGNGDACDLTGSARKVVVKLKCKESVSPHAVTIYMFEPEPCRYILVVESSLLCSILDTSDENGLLSLPQ
uniref:endoplasmic reticulum lectin 1 isoform X1 n=1 Tax=Myxine glutinosa TaxID=7769 RepID=UPI00358DF497